jgi:hypothetical protein
LSHEVVPVKSALRAASAGSPLSLSLTTAVRRCNSAAGRNNVATAGRYRYRGLHDALAQHYRTRIVAPAAVRDAGHVPEQGGFRVGRESRQTEAAKGEQDPGSGFLVL